MQPHDVGAVGILTWRGVLGGRGWRASLELIGSSGRISTGFVKHWSAILPGTIGPLVVPGGALWLAPPASCLCASWWVGIDLALQEKSVYTLSTVTELIIDAVSENLSPSCAPEQF
jgi:hypothetical protein